MGLNTGISIIDQISDIGIKDIFAYQAAKNQQKIDLGMADTSNYVARLNAQAALLQGQVAANAYQQQNTSAFTDNKWLWIGGAVLAVGVVVMLVKSK